MSKRCGCLFTSQPSLDPDANAVTKIPGNRFGPDIVVRGLSEAIQPDLLVGELEPAAERAALHHLQIACRVSLLDRMQQHLAGEAEVAALTQGVERFVLRPDGERLSQPA